MQLAPSVVHRSASNRSQNDLSIWGEPLGWHSSCFRHSIHWLSFRNQEFSNTQLLPSGVEHGIPKDAHRETVLPAFLCELGRSISFDLNEKFWRRQEWSTIAATFAGRTARGKI